MATDLHVGARAQSRFASDGDWENVTVTAVESDSFSVVTDLGIFHASVPAASVRVAGRGTCSAFAMVVPSKLLLACWRFRSPLCCKDS